MMLSERHSVVEVRHGEILSGVLVVFVSLWWCGEVFENHNLAKL